MYEITWYEWLIWLALWLYFFAYRDEIDKIADKIFRRFGL
jgi:hypothetical protein